MLLSHAQSEPALQANNDGVFVVRTHAGRLDVLASQVFVFHSIIFSSIRSAVQAGLESERIWESVKKHALAGTSNDNMRVEQGQLCYIDCNNEASHSNSSQPACQTTERD